MCQGGENDCNGKKSFHTVHHPWSSAEHECVSDDMQKKHPRNVSMKRLKLEQLC